MKSWLRTFICFGLAFFMLELLMTGEISLYISPRLNWLVAVGIVLLVVLGVVQLWNLKKQDMHRIGAWGYVMAIIPMLLLLFVAPKTLDASSVQKKGMNIASMQQPVEIAKDQGDPYLPIAEKLAKEPVITFTEKDYVEIINTINMYPDRLKGKKVKMHGFVYRDESLKPDEFVLGRFMVSCCTADGVVTGFLIQTDQAGTFRNDQWIEIDGSVETEVVDGIPYPIIKLNNFKQIEPMKDPYVYVNY
ncbi:TIGR03943 family putative permease subunit [Risungbinella massiliensis]|uniref:TIGR03943 family putative permease subunit n=1 Tax=Risungbinella massiliensis TaxID=1329796 RepID=UPI0005CBD1BF|nr:TIGR03943 family protein [Risungbinella massiliensis]